MPIAHRLAVIPDVHMRRKMFHFAIDLHEEGYPLLFLGDYADKGPHGNDPKLLRELFAFAVAHQSILLIGNHDIAYLYPAEKRFRIPGFEEKNSAQLAKVYDDYREHFTFLHRVDKYVFSHAGLGIDFLSAIKRKNPSLALDDTIALLNAKQLPELFYRSAFNGGTDPFDGPLWIRPEQFDGALTEEGITQVVGHSSQASIRLKHNLLMVDVQLPLIMEW